VLEFAIMAKKKVGKVIVPPGLKPTPKENELAVANLIANYFELDVEFIVSTTVAVTPDFCIDGFYWELKTPRGSGKRTIENLLRKASRQAANIIVDLSYTKMTRKTVEGEILRQAKKGRKFKRVIIITKTMKVIDLAL
jgi:hypothetical protein